MLQVLLQKKKPFKVVFIIILFFWFPIYSCDLPKVGMDLLGDIVGYLWLPVIYVGEPIVVKCL